MLSYEQEALIEVEPHAIRYLSRSTATVTYDSGGRDAFEVHCTLCDYLEGSERSCRVVFYARNLKKSLVFKVNGPDRLSSWRYGRDILLRLGFRLEEVNLKLSPVLLEVVLRDVPGIATPADARKLGDEKKRSLAECHKILDNAPASSHGKKAALKLSTEKRNQERIQELRKILERTLLPVVDVTADLEELAARFKVLEQNLAGADEQAEIERRKRETSESITAAAEKRIQELEENLVDAETKIAGTLKLKRKNVKLNEQVKKLCESLESAEQEVKSEQEKQEQLHHAVKSAQQQLVSLNDELQDTCRSMEKVQAQLIKEQSDRARLEECLKDAEICIKDLELESEGFAVKLAAGEDAVKKVEDLEAQLAKNQQALQHSLGKNTQLREDLQKAIAEGESLARELRGTEASDREILKYAERETALKKQNEQITEELALLRSEYVQECGERQRLEECVAEDKQRINDLQSALASMVKKAEECTAERRASAEPDEEGAELRETLLGLKSLHDHDVRLQGELEIELCLARERIDALEEMVREDNRYAVVSEGDASSESALSCELEEKLRSFERQLALERKERDHVALALAEAEKQLAGLQDLLSQGRTGKGAQQIAEPASPAATDAIPLLQVVKPLPHDLRPAPRKGALFRPEWDLTGLPCRSSAEVAKAWESAFNVQISLEGYPSQYCMAFLVVLQFDREKKLYMLYRLRQNKHTLVCVPVNTTEDEKSMQNVLEEGLKFLKRSGFDMEEMTVENIDSTLANYFQKI